jgi:hypothetical protein
MQALNPIPKRKFAAGICSNCLLRRLTQQNRSTLRIGLQASPRIARSIHTSRPLFEDAQEQQAQPLGDYYSDLLSSHVRPAPPKSKLPTFVQSGDMTKEQRAARLFGTIEGSGYEHHISPESTWKTINGVAVPPRPAEPDNCCMRGCVHCVWDDYRDDIEHWAGRLKEAQAKGQQRDEQNPKAYTSRAEVQHASSSMDDDGGGSEALWNAPSVPGNTDTGEELFQGIPIGIREFMATEKRIRERNRERKRRKS